MNKISYSGKPMRFAHRGLVQYAPENTLEAFKSAVEYGCEGIEIDVRISADGEIMVCHDDSFKRMSDGRVTSKIENMTADEIRKVDLFYAGHLLPHNPPVPYSESEGSIHTYTPEEIAFLRETDKRIAHLMTFEEFDEWFTGVEDDVIIEIEIKSNGCMPRFREILSKSPNCPRYILFSGEKSVVEEIQAEFKNDRPEGLRLAANIRYINEETLEIIGNSDFWEVGLNDRKYTSDDVKMLGEKGIKTFSNLGDYPEYWNELQSLGVEGFKTNYAEAYTEWWNEVAK